MTFFFFFFSFSRRNSNARSPNVLTKVLSQMSTAPTKPISRDEALERIIKLSSNMPQLEFATQTAFGVSTATIDNPHAILVPALPLEVPTQPHNNVADVVYSTPLEASQSLELEQHPVESSFFLCFDNIPGSPEK
jgi:hypothetical protein